MTKRGERALIAVGIVLIVGWIAAEGAPWSPVVRGDRVVLGVAGALVVAALLALGPARRARAIAYLAGGDSRTFALVVSTLAAVLTWKFAKDNLGDRGYSIDGSVYVMQARAMSHGHFGAALRSPFHAFGARFLFEGPDHRLYGVFPPGWPLFLAAFVKLDLLRWQGAFVAFGLSMAQWWLGRTIVAASPSASPAHDEVAVRASLVVALLAFPRTVLTADAMSHAFVAALVAVAVTLSVRAFSPEVRGSARRSALAGLGIGVCIGWSFSARLLDGLVLGLCVGLVLLVGAIGRRVRVGLLVVALAAALPFAGLVLASQKAATGSALTPTQEAYFQRSDWPPTCHRLGFGRDVGCAVEHGDVRAAMPDGYGFKEAVAVTRSRAKQLGVDLFGEALLSLLAFAVVALRPSKAHAALGAFALAFTLSYGLFYYGNAPSYGARHLFPIATLMLLLFARGMFSPVARASGVTRAQLVVAGLAACALVVTQARRWDEDWPHLRGSFWHKSDLRRVLDAHEIEAGILRAGDRNTVIAAYDPDADGADRIIVADDETGASEVRRTRPDLPVLLALADEQIGRFPAPLPAPQRLVVQLEREWPSFLHTHGVAAKVKTVGGTSANPSRSLHLFVAEPGGSIELPFEVGVGGTFTLRVDGVAGPDHGNYDLSLDGAPLPPYLGYASTPGPIKGRETPPTFLARGRHVLVAKLAARDPQSTGDLADFDALVGEPAR